MPELIDITIEDFSSTDKGAGYKTKLQQMLEKLRYSIQQYNAQLQSGATAAAQLAAIQAIRDHIDQVEQNVEVIAQGDLPAQTGKTKRAFVTNGTTAGWEHIIGCNRFEATNLTLAAGDRVAVLCASSRIATLPATIAADDPIYLLNRRDSVANLVLAVPSAAAYSLVVEPGITIAPGSNTHLAPGEWMEMQALDANTLIVLRSNPRTQDVQGLTQRLNDLELASTPRG